MCVILEPYNTVEGAITVLYFFVCLCWGREKNIGCASYPNLKGRFSSDYIPFIRSAVKNPDHADRECRAVIIMAWETG